MEKPEENTAHKAKSRSSRSKKTSSSSFSSSHSSSSSPPKLKGNDNFPEWNLSLRNSLQTRDLLRYITKNPPPRPSPVPVKESSSTTTGTGNPPVPKPPRVMDLFSASRQHELPSSASPLFAPGSIMNASPAAATTGSSSSSSSLAPDPLTKWRSDRARCTQIIMNSLSEKAIKTILNNEPRTFEGHGGIKHTDFDVDRDPDEVDLVEETDIETILDGPSPRALYNLICQCYPFRTSNRDIHPRPPHMEIFFEAKDELDDMGNGICREDNLGAAMARFRFLKRSMEEIGFGRTEKAWNMILKEHIRQYEPQPMSCFSFEEVFLGTREKRWPGRLRPEELDDGEGGTKGKKEEKIWKPIEEHHPDFSMDEDDDEEEDEERDPMPPFGELDEYLA